MEENKLLRKPEEVIINGKKLSDILSDHLHWLKGDVDGCENMWANLENVDLSNVNLNRVNLSGARLYKANLKLANLSYADLSGTDLAFADLSNVNLTKANLFYTDLYGANLYKANLGSANLRGVNFIKADLSDANLYNADLNDADLNEANLRDADLREAKISDTDLDNAILPDNFYYPMVCPEDGSFTGYKKAILNNTCEYCIVKLSIPEDAKRSSSTTRKCRCDKAKVLAIYDLDHNKLDDDTIAFSDYDNTFEYEVNKMVSVSDFDTNRWNECSTGIHFFINFREAVEYKL